MEHHHEVVDCKGVLYGVVVETDNSAWPEVYGSKAEVDAFIRGVRAGASMHGNFDVVREDVKVIDHENKDDESEV